MGKFDGETGNSGYDDSARRPTVADLEVTLCTVLDDYLQQFPQVDPYRMPKVSTLAVQWFIDLVEQSDGKEYPHRERNYKNTRFIWRWPYEQRLINYLIAYLRADNKFQRVIVAAREDGIYWRGDDQYFFMRMIAETERMRCVGRDEYRRQAITAMRGLDMSAGA